MVCESNTKYRVIIYSLAQILCLDILFERRNENLQANLTRFLKMTISYSFSGHETFSLRHGWLKKGVDATKEKGADVLSADQAMIRLGVGKNMVRSIRHWCLATHVLEESEKRGELKPSDLGARLFSDGGFDPYLEDSATLWLLHWHLATNRSYSTTWFFTFNHFGQAEFNKEKIAFEIQSWLEKQSGGKKPVSENTLSRDVDCFLRTYVLSRQSKTSVSEDSLDCPLADLRLITELDDGRTYRFNRGSQDSLPDEIFVYGLEHFWRAERRPETIALSKMVSEVGSPARVFKLDENSLVQRLEKIKAVSGGAFDYDETSGLRQIYRRGEIDLNELLEKCYRKKAIRAGAAK
jgi:hypothetical protein